jgi:multisubunit Na+/H+ antiporter MnhB subunit
MSVIIRTATKIMFPAILLYGLYVVFHGHFTPGGTFSGGTIMVGAFLLYTLAYGIERTEAELRESVAEFLKSIAGLVLIILIIFEFILRKYLVPSEHIFSLWSGGELLFLNIVGGLMVFSGLLLIWYTVVKIDEEL